MSFRDGSILNSDPSTAQSSQLSISMSSGSREITNLVCGHCWEALNLLSVGCKKT
jgi:methyl coenzyme M reductase subunit C